MLNTALLLNISERFEAIKKETLAQMFSYEVFELFKNTFLIQHLGMAAYRGSETPENF